MQKQVIMGNLQYYPNIFQEGTTKMLVKVVSGPRLEPSASCTCSRSVTHSNIFGQDSNPGLPVPAAEALPIRTYLAKT